MTTLTKSMIIAIIIHTCLGIEFNPIEIEKEISEKDIACGFAIRISSLATTFKLHSHKINYGSGSGQQVVSSINDANDPGSLWLVKESHGENACTTGKILLCGQKIRLQHVISGKNLHSDLEYKAPFSKKQEVSLFGYNGNGDESDDWIVECANNEDFVKGDTILFFKHAVTNKYLTTDSKHTFDHQNCPNCPIIGQREVSASNKRGVSPSGKWSEAFSSL